MLTEATWNFELVELLHLVNGNAKFVCIAANTNDKDA